MSKPLQSSRKRPRSNDADFHDKRLGRKPASASTTPSIPPAAYVQAYEAQLIYVRADVADGVAGAGEKDDGTGQAPRERARLVPWAGTAEGVEEGSVWADRYDILHLVSDLPAPRQFACAGPSSPAPASPSSSWDSLPSDLEETFYLSDPDEIAEYERAKRVRWVEALRARRLADREEEDARVLEVAAEAEAEAEADADAEAEPPDAVLGLMRHTAAALARSPDGHVLRMRILANHAADERFAFLRGRWEGAWGRVQREAEAKLGPAKKGERAEKEREGRERMQGLMGGYESSEGEEETEEGQRAGETAPKQRVEKSMADTVGEVGPELSEAEKQKQRRLRAEEWKRKRAAELTKPAAL